MLNTDLQNRVEYDFRLIDIADTVDEDYPAILHIGRKSTKHPEKDNVHSAEHIYIDDPSLSSTHITVHRTENDYLELRNHSKNGFFICEDTHDRSHFVSREISSVLIKSGTILGLGYPKIFLDYYKVRPDVCEELISEECTAFIRFYTDYKTKLFVETSKPSQMEPLYLICEEKTISSKQFEKVLGKRDVKDCLATILEEMKLTPPGTFYQIHTDHNSSFAYLSDEDLSTCTDYDFQPCEPSSRENLYEMESSAEPICSSTDRLLLKAENAQVLNPKKRKRHSVHLDNINTLLKMSSQTSEAFLKQIDAKNEEIRVLKNTNKRLKTAGRIKYLSAGYVSGVVSLIWALMKISSRSSEP